jgi:hypothetical protein
VSMRTTDSGDIADCHGLPNCNGKSATIKKSILTTWLWPTGIAK